MPSYINIGTTLLDIEEIDLTVTWRELLEVTGWDIPQEEVRKFLTYLTLYNNFVYEQGEHYPRTISKVDVFKGFFYVLLTLAAREETLTRVDLLFDYWISFLNDNVDIFDKKETGDAWIEAAVRFLKNIEEILDNDKLLK